MRNVLLAFCVVLVCGAARPLVARADAVLDQAAVERGAGQKGTWNEKEAVYRLTLPRTDLAVTTAGVRMTPALGLTCWAAFTRAGEHALMMGDLVLLEDQVSAVMDVALANHLEVTALHNHFLWDRPKVMFMHVSGMGAEETLGQAVAKLFAAIRASAASPPATPLAEIDPAAAPGAALDPKPIETALGVTGTLDAGVLKLTIGRSVTMHGRAMGGAMGVNTWAAFAGTDARAVVDGDFAVLESELQDVIRMLRAAHIHVVAIHNHMTGEEPRMLFLHYWGVGTTRDLAAGLRAALDRTQRGV